MTLIDMARICGILLIAGCSNGEGNTNPKEQPLARQISALVADFTCVPLEGKDASGDKEAYLNACKKADVVAREIWRLTKDADKVVDFWVLQRACYALEAEKCEKAYVAALEKERASAQGCGESRRLHNLRCMYQHSIEMEDESILMEVVSNKFFSSSRKEFDKSMATLRKALGRNFGYDEQLRLLFPQANSQPVSPSDP